jgi:hypothetical protein
MDLDIDLVSDQLVLLLDIFVFFTLDFFLYMHVQVIVVGVHILLSENYPSIDPVTFLRIFNIVDQIIYAILKWFVDLQTVFAVFPVVVIIDRSELYEWIDINDSSVRFFYGFFLLNSSGVSVH